MEEISELHREITRIEGSLNKHWPKGDYPEAYRELQEQMLDQIMQLAAQLPILIEDDD